MLPRLKVAQIFVSHRAKAATRRVMLLLEWTVTVVKTSSLRPGRESFLGLRGQIFFSYVIFPIRNSSPSSRARHDAARCVDSCYQVKASPLQAHSGIVQCPHPTFPFYLKIFPLKRTNGQRMLPPRSPRKIPGSRAEILKEFSKSSQRVLKR